MLSTLLALIAATASAQDATYVGAAACLTCHQAEHAVWDATKHAQSFKSVHKNPLSKDILAAVGGGTNIRKNQTCIQCHFTIEPNAEGVQAARSGVSCEKCHGAASKWMPIHNDYGGKNVSRAAETPEHKANRIAAAKAAGQLRPDMKLEIAQNCASCHGLSQPGVDAETFAKMLKAGHPAVADFELVRYSQGSVRHRFYDPKVNAETPPADLARLFVLGQAAKLVSAAAASAAAPDGDYKTFQAKRADDARKALGTDGLPPEAAKLSAEPSLDNARALAAALDGKDLSAALKDLLPPPASYK
ncbi:MAG: hypothetical protein HYZ75_03970 [Elusimicrobia bacterium]|nr:hypothetical protein [Elusimicrobiota bacterium]